MNFPGIYGHETVKERLTSAFQKDRIPSAYLFLGDDGIGKSSLVKEFAQLLNCEKKSICHICPNCRLFDSNAHPDFHVIQRNGKFIRIAQIHELIAQLSLKPAYATKRVVLVKGADCLNQESANSFLKILEEPPLDTLIVLTTSDENLLLETILSRCQKVMFAPLSQDVLIRILKEKFKLTGKDALFVINYSGGRIRKDFISNIAILDTLRRQVFSMLCNLNLEQMVDHSVLLEGWVKKELHFYFLEFCAVWLKDLLYLKEEKGNQITNGDMADEVDSSCISVSPSQLSCAFNLVIETELAIRANAGKLLALESLIIQIKHVFAGKIVI